MPPRAFESQDVLTLYELFELLRAKRNFFEKNPTQKQQQARKELPARWRHARPLASLSLLESSVNYFNYVNLVADSRA